MNSKISIIPMPNDIKMLKGKCEIKESDTIKYTSVCKTSGKLLAQITGLKKDKKGKISLKISKDIRNKEGYILEVKPEGVVITGGSDRGAFYGVQSLRQMMGADIVKEGIKDSIALPCAVICDEPRFQYRGYMLDVARHFFDIDIIKRQLDLMALHKLNKFHWHLSDDQGFRIEIAKYPLLTKIGGYRKRTLVKGYMLPWGRKYDESRCGGYYTAEDIAEVIEYAKSLNIDIIPEIDMPGHMMAALSAYPEHSCRGEGIEVACEPTISKDVLCVGKDKAIDFAIEILTEVGRMFPYKHIHIGGDEVKCDRWKKCPDCRQRMKDNGIKKAEKLQEYFVNTVSSKMKAKGYTIIGWDGVLSENVDKDIINEYWSPNGKEKSIVHINEGTKTIFAPFSKYYLDYTFSLIPLKQSYEYDPVDEYILKEKSNCMLGVEGALWTEYVDSEDRINWQAYPLLAAVSETGWTNSYEKDYKGFLSRLAVLEKIYDALGVNHCISQVYTYEKKPRYLSMFFRSDHIANIAYYKHNEDKRNYDK